MPKMRKEIDFENGDSEGEHFVSWFEMSVANSMMMNTKTLNDLETGLA